MEFYQLKITRKGTKPPVWRRCTVAADVTFARMAAMLEKLVQYPAGSLYEIEFFQKKVQIRENGDGEAKNNFTLLNAGETETAELMDSEKWFTFRQYGADKEVPEYRVDIEKKEEGTPLFVFNVTMQNHGGYSDTYDNFTPDITVEGVESTPLSQYLSLVRLSDQALEKLISYFEEADEKTIVVFFGDHQPNDTVAAPILNLNGMTTKTLTEDQLKLRYEVPYVIWANYDIDAESGKDTSANYLAADVLHYAGISENAYGSYLLELQQNYPVISAMRVLTKDGLDTNSSSLKQELKDYQSLQYYQLFDWKKE